MEFAAALRAEAAALGVPADDVFVFSAAEPYWSFHLVAGSRRFEVRVGHREGLRCWECTAGREKNLIPPGAGPVFGASARLRHEALRLVQHALRHPEFAYGEPQIV